MFGPVNLFKFNKLIFLLSFAIGFWLFLSPGTLCVTVLTIALLYIFSLNFKDPSQRNIIITICIIAISLRFICSIFNYYFSWSMRIGADFIPDARAYSASGQYIAEAITNKSMPSSDGNEPEWLDSLRKTFKGFTPLEYRMDAFARYIGLVYSIFGYSPITVKFINGFLSLFTGILLFLLVKDFFSIKVANIALVLSLFWPSIFLWSIVGSKDSIVLFLVSFFIFIFTKLRKYINTFDLLLIGGVLFVKNYNINLLLFIVILLYRLIKKFTMKSSIRYFLIFLVLILILKITAESILLIRRYLFTPLEITFFLSIISFLNKRQLKFLLSIILLLALFLIFYVSKNNLYFKKYFAAFTGEAIRIQKCQLYAANSAYRIYPDRYYEEKYTNYSDMKNITPLEFIASYFKGLTYTLFSPFPWSSNNKIQFFASFQMIIYYLLIPFLFLGILVSLRFRWRYMLPIIIFLFITTSICALFEGNVGTLFRHRDILTNFYFIFIAIGISKLLGYIKLSQFNFR